MSTLRLGTRKSALALAQANWVSAQLKSTFPNLNIEFVLMTTTGDIRTETAEPAHRGGGLKAFFTKEIEEALLERKIDFAVHSAKDLASDLPSGLIIRAVPAREDPHDAWISRTGVAWKNIPPHGRIATGAVRRQAQLLHHRPDLELLPLRGNVDTRLRKLQEGDWDGIILALAGLKRLGRENEATDILSEEIMLPAAGQGALAIQTRDADPDVDRFIDTLDHLPTHQALLAERAFLSVLGGSCQTPIAAYACVLKDRMSIQGLVAAPNGTPYLRSTLEGSPADGTALGKTLAKRLIAEGADKLLRLLS